ncbi:MAG TPA: hypothetical protein VJ870_09635 [Amycolatopsis sp.]|nr:hypothetical protein [Amycolatopsis sp.]
MTIAEPWRGRGLGAALGASALRIFAPYARFAVCGIPADWSRIRAGRVVDAIGFRPWRDVHIIDLRNPMLLNARDQLLECWWPDDGHQPTA